MKGSLRSRLGLSYFLVVLICLGMVTPLTWLAIEQLYRQTQGENLLAQARLIASALGSSETQISGSPVPYTQSSNLAYGIHSRVIDPQGGVVIDLSPTGLSASPQAVILPQLAQNATGTVTAAELFARPEIASARKGLAATAIRQVDVAGGKPVLYAAAPVITTDRTVSQIVYLATPLPDTQWAALPLTLRWQFGGVILAGVILAGAAGWLLARRISAPLRQLGEAAVSVARGDLEQSVPEDQSISDLAVLGRAFNTMTASLRQSAQAKNAFVADVSHELRTPLTVIKGTIETLQDGAIDDPKVREPFLDSMNHETDRLIRLVNDLLVLTRADAGALKLQENLFDLVALARSRCAMKTRGAYARSVEIRIQTGKETEGDNLTCACGDADRIAQVIDNLLDNAIRFSPPGGQVTVNIVNEPERVICEVCDQGPGIPPEHLPLIFERFYRADPARDRDRGGSGLGLAIVRSLVNAHGGQVEALSTPGRGATFRFWLPVVSAVHTTDTEKPAN